MKDGSEAVDLEAIEVDSSAAPAATSGRRLDIQIKPSSQDLGRADGLRHTILTLVSEQEYERAIKRLVEFQESKHEYPKFDIRAGRYVRYATDLINAIKAKRSFPGWHFLNMSKQKELHDRAKEHFDDLTATIRKIEQIDVEVRAEDFRSTVLVVKAAIYSLFAILIIGFFRELSRGVLPALGFVIDDSFTGVMNWVFDTLGL